LTIKLKTDAHQSFACRLVCDSFFRKHCVCLWSEKTTVCRIFSCQRSGLPDSAGNLFTSGVSGAPPEQRSTNHRPTSMCARLNSLIRSPKLFKEPSLNKTPRCRDRSYRR